MPKKLTYEYVREQIENRGYVLVSGRYINQCIKLDVGCPKHGVFKAPFRSIRDGYGCPTCAIESQRVPFDRVKGEIENRGYHLLSEDYVNNSAKLKILCNEHGVFEKTYTMFAHQNQGCPTCMEHSGGRVKHSIGYIRAEVESRGYGLISNIYIHSHKKIKILCLDHGMFKMAYKDFHQMKGCPACAEYGFNPEKPATLYYLEVLNRGRYYYKVGITNRTVQKRYSSSDLEKITILAEWDYEYGGDCRKEEQEILEEFDEWRYRGSAKILRSGNTELFTENVLQL